MKNKHLLAYSIILAALIAIHIFQLRSSRVDILETGLVSLFPEIDVTTIKKIRATKGSVPDAYLELIKKDDMWLVANKDNINADQEKVSNLLSEIKETKGELRSDSPELFSSYWLEDEKAVHLEFLTGDGERVIDFLFGKKGETGQSTFIRKTGDNKVYSAAIRLNSIFQVWFPEDGVNPARWCDLRLLSHDNDEYPVRCSVYLPGEPEFRLETPSNEKTANTSMGKWEVVHPPGMSSVDNRELVGIISGLWNMRGEDVFPLASRSQYKLEKPPYRAILYVGEDRFHEIHVSPLEEAGYAAVVVEGDFVYQLSKTTFDSTFGKVKELFTGGKKVD